MLTMEANMERRVGEVRRKFTSTRILKISSKLNLKLLTVLIVIVANINLSTCYSSVRRSGSFSVNNESKEVINKIKPNISPMLRPATVKSQSDIETLNIVNNISVEETNSTNGADYNLEFNEFKPLPLDPNFKIPIIENDESDKIVSKKDDKLKIIKQIDDAIDLIENREENPEKAKRLSALEEDILGYVDDTFTQDYFKLFEGVKIEPVSSLKPGDVNSSYTGAPRSLETTNTNENFDNRIMTKIAEFARTHKITVNFPETARFFGFKYISSLWRKAGRYARRWLKSKSLWFGGTKTTTSGYKPLSNSWTSKSLQPRNTWSQVTYSGPNNYIWPQNPQWPYGGKNTWPNYGGMIWPSVTKIWPNVQSINVERTTTPPSEIKRTSSSWGT